jgi:hypothetical protein
MQIHADQTARRERRADRLIATPARLDDMLGACDLFSVICAALTTETRD